MKKNIIFTMISMLLLLAVFIVWYVFPKQHTQTLQAVSFQLGTDEEAEQVSIHIDGKVKKQLFGNMTFEGFIEIDGEELPVPEPVRQVKVNFQSNGLGSLIFAGFDNGKPFTYSYGSMFASEDFSEITILKGSWDSEEGKMFVAPADSRMEAIRISNELMEDFLQGTILK